jgi:hypothetical protein
LISIALSEMEIMGIIVLGVKRDTFLKSLLKGLN